MYAGRGRVNEVLSMGQEQIKGRRDAILQDARLLETERSMSASFVRRRKQNGGHTAVEWRMVLRGPRLLCLKQRAATH